MVTTSHSCRSGSSVKDLVGIGIGPFNLSLAALLDHVPALQAAFYDAKPEFSWHEGLMFPRSILQTSFLKDLVTPVLPTSPHSFVNFLVAHKRFYDFMAGRFTGVSRSEFASYMGWVAHGLPSTNWNMKAQAIRFGGDAFEIDFENGRRVRARNLAIATGMTANTPEWAVPHMGPTCFHAGSYLHPAPDTAGKRVVVVGGGQTGAEIVLDLLTQSRRRPAQVSWISKLSRFSPLEEGGFVDHVFTPGYIDAYRTLPEAAKRSEVGGQKLASDGLTPATIEALYEEIYRRRHLDAGPDGIALLPGRSVTGLEADGGAYRIITQTTALNARETFPADVVILAMGARACLPDCMAPLKPLIRCDRPGVPALHEDYRMDFDGPSTNRIYGLNLGLASHGIADPQMSLMAWRAATIVNSLQGHDVFDLSRAEDLICWPREGDPRAHEAQARAMTSAIAAQ
ncbi:SidA/IucD/PvdA family monooxygenase [Breoghania sp.]|uniref:lysine N(6)-hydroxylase/L-ornithine N(5)-oxygenase family protein n=1 Tax=Breoghania sp. TaxID=2065378 RepID=UPI002AA887A9|nr:SidA/IucD/PvdA family monooxygenase [Breoghania sp.]